MRIRNLKRCAVLGIGLIAVLTSQSLSYAEDNIPTKMRDRVALLEQQVDQLTRDLEELLGSEEPGHVKREIEEILSKLQDLNGQISALSMTILKNGAGDTEQDARLDDLAAEITAIWKETESLKVLIATEIASPTAGYENGFFVKSKDDKFRLTINGFVCPYYLVSFQKEWETSPAGAVIGDENGNAIGGDTEIQENTFGVANARLSLQIQALGVLRGVFEMDFGTHEGTVLFPPNSFPGLLEYNRVKISDHSLKFMDVYAEYAPFKELHVRAGRMKVPFDRESLFHDGLLTFTTLSLMTSPYANWAEFQDPNNGIFGWDYEMQRASSFGRDLGVELAGSLANGLFNYALGAFNGAGESTTNDNRDVLVAARLSSDILGPMTPDMSDMGIAQRPLLSIGAAFAYDLLEHAHILNPSVEYNSRDVSLEGDFHFKWLGISALTGVFYRHSEHGQVFFYDSGEEYPIDTMGFMGQLAYYSDATKLEPAYRYSIYDADLAYKLDHVHEHTLSLAYHPFPGYLKLQLQYRGLYPAQSNRTYLLPQPNQSGAQFWFDYYHEITVMAQVAF